MTDCTLMDKFITGNTKHCHHYDHFNYRMIMAVSIILAIGVPTAIIVNDYQTEYWDNIPMVEREVMANVIYSESTRCIFVVEGERVRSGACQFGVGEVVETKSDGKTIRMYNGVYDDTMR